ncbi:MAG: hypothetical protein WCW61_03480 [Patescibacteria group bacterium]
MNTEKVDQIVKLSLDLIFSEKFKDGNYQFYFHSEEIDLHQEVAYSDHRDAKGNEPVSYQYKEYFLFGPELGFRPIEMLAGSKSLADRIIEADANCCWYQYQDVFTSFSHIVEMSVYGTTGETEDRIIKIYKVKFDQWAELANKSLDFLNNLEVKPLKKKKK